MSTGQRGALPFPCCAANPESLAASRGATQFSELLQVKFHPFSNLLRGFLSLLCSIKCYWPQLEKTSRMKWSSVSYQYKPTNEKLLKISCSFHPQEHFPKKFIVNVDLVKPQINSAFSTLIATPQQNASSTYSWCSLNLFNMSKELTINFFHFQGNNCSGQKEESKELFHLAFSCISTFTKQLLRRTCHGDSFYCIQACCTAPVGIPATNES